MQLQIRARGLALLAIAAACAAEKTPTHGRLPVPPQSVRKPPMGFSSWNHFGMRVSAPLLLDTADAFSSTGLKRSGYVYINTDDGDGFPT